MGTRWSARLVLADAGDATAHAARVQTALDEVVAQMSQWEQDSALSRFNRLPAGTWFELPPEFAEVIAEALDIAALSGGAFDPTLGALADLWGFGAEPVATRPSPSDLAAARDAAGWKRLEFDPDARRLRQPGGLRLDLSGIAKGFGVDRAAAALAEAGLGSFLVEVGGELVGHGVRPDGQPWWVALEDPQGARLAPFRVALFGIAAATSGDYRRFHDVAGQRLPHSLDPRSGGPSTGGTAAVTVLATTAMRADALATALAVLGDEAEAFAAEHGVAARIVRRAGHDCQEVLTPALQAMFD